jgi:hypothetical protein
MVEIIGQICDGRRMESVCIPQTVIEPAPLESTSLAGEITRYVKRAFFPLTRRSHIRFPSDVIPAMVMRVAGCGALPCALPRTALRPARGGLGCNPKTTWGAIKTAVSASKTAVSARMVCLSHPHGGAYRTSAMYSNRPLVCTVVMCS